MTLNQKKHYIYRIWQYKPFVMTIICKILFFNTRLIWKESKD